MNEFVQVVSSVGFPIVCAGALFWYIVNIQSGITDALNNNTRVIEKMLHELDEVKKDVQE